MKNDGHVKMTATYPEQQPEDGRPATLHEYLLVEFQDLVEMRIVAPAPAPN